MKELSQALVRQHHLVVSHWFDLSETLPNFGHLPGEMREFATNDLAALIDADILVMFNDNAVVSHGKAVEWGYMLARRSLTVEGGSLATVIVGKQHHVFDYLCDHHFRNVSELLEWTDTLYKSRV